MDTSETYIKMCEKAEEIQPKLEDDGVGGTWIGHSILYHLAPMNQPHDRDGYYHITDEEAIRKCETCGHEEPYIYKTTAIWLPRQDQLQEMLPFPVGTFNDNFWSALDNIHKWGFEQKFIDYIPLSMDQLWLAFVMKENHGKRWSGTNWELEVGVLR